MVNKENLRKLMEAQGIDGRELARCAKVSDAMMSYILSGDKVPGLATIGRIAKRLGCKVEDIIIY